VKSIFSKNKEIDFKISEFCYKVAFCPRISRISLIFFREISVIRGLIFFYLTLWTDTN